jgi:hypothetical protein
LFIIGFEVKGKPDHHSNELHRKGRELSKKKCGLIRRNNEQKAKSSGLIQLKLS